MVNYNLIITNLYTETVDGLQDYVVVAAFNVIGTDGEFSSTVNGTQTFAVKEGQQFIPYSELTPEIVTEWIKEGLGESGLLSITTYIDSEIEKQKNPPIVPQDTPLPW